MPRSAQVVLAIDDQDVFIAQALELDRRADSAETRPYDHYVELLHAHRHYQYSFGIGVRISSLPAASRPLLAGRTRVPI